ncbi:hypothetical protein N7491_005621 [Penicillium cf. griseofulvum]|uniref:MYND-type domain-containing protein n=1 Tax=Penicillium cf. griseofulvum TaxID=2972120 RepID=A0A9W9M555_9EURO|nr:hypothetical protein N7472_008307 [Penicillium cf. griseofulvum]KAJ5435026.1 hypothetical protein N7491_005621 [Penicillium cf. griseofulvum]KAJ5452860.1 hypothetical protein N7445_001043 [Penicillium cf. griseofulvum]
MSRFDKLLNPAFCANNINSPCSNKTSKANNACSRCFLVVYCSKECQKEHWPTHKEDCKNIIAQDSWKPGWHTEKREPTFLKKRDPSESNTNEGRISWWGAMPAVDLLKLDANEGQDAPPKIRILLASSHDIRNMVKTIARLPVTYSGQCEIVMNGIHSGIFCQNVVLVLVAFHFRPEEATPIMVHLWYSAMIPASVLEALQAKLLPLIQEVCAEAAQKRSVPIFKMAWKKNKASLQVELPRHEWERLREYLQVPSRLSATTAARNRQEVTMAPKREDELHRFLYAQPQYWRVSSMKFRSDGILLPFGCSREAFDTPNPTLFHASHSWPMPDTADPRTSWDLLEVCNGSYTANYSAKNDLYGLIFIHLRETLLGFCHQVAKRDISIRLLSIDSLKLPKYFEEPNGYSKFDRIETYITAEREVLGIEVVLGLFTHLLKPKIQNPKAMLLVLFIRDVEDMWNGESLKSDLARTAKYLPQPESTNFNDADHMRAKRASTFFRNVSKLFDLYKRSAKFHALTKYGLKMRGNSTVVAHWPMRPGKHTTQHVFDILEASGATGCERYIEWEWA